MTPITPVVRSYVSQDKELMLCVYDYLKSKGHRNPKKTFEKVLEQHYSELVDKVLWHKFAGKGQKETLVAPEYVCNMILVYLHQMAPKKPKIPF